MLIVITDSIVSFDSMNSNDSYYRKQCYLYSRYTADNHAEDLNAELNEDFLQYRDRIWGTKYYNGRSPPQEPLYNLIAFCMLSLERVR